MRERRFPAYLTLVATVAALLTWVSPVAAQPPAAPATTTPDSPVTTAPAPPRQLTLFTGDRVTVHGDQITVAPRDGVQFLTLQRGEDDYVIPSDAVPLLRADRLDDELFNVTALLEYDFDELSHLPLIVSDRSRVSGLATGAALAAVDGFATEVPVGELASSWQRTRTTLSSGKIWLDGVSESALDASVPMIGAPAAWASGWDGTGVTVAVIDTGIDDTHPDLAGRVAARENFVPELETALDLNGHGTHVASTVAGTGAASGGGNRGVAPGAALLDAKACYEAGGGLGLCPDSAILRAMQWAVDSGAEVVNMSLGDIDDPGIDPLEQAVNDLTAEYGTLFVVAAGNYGSLFQDRVGSPSTADAALSVANFDKAGDVNIGSLPGPRAGDYGVKPDIGAPGTAISAARAPGALGHLPEGHYVGLTGTSMAAPHVAGAAALLAQAHPDWTPEQSKAALMGSATPNPEYSVFAQGAGLMDVANALRQPVTATPPSLSIGVLQYPHTEPPTTRTMTYHNSGDAPVTLDLALAGDAPAELLALSAPSVTVPAGGNASVNLVVDERATTAHGLFSGYLVATGGDISVRTPFSVYQEEPAAGLSISAIGRTGGDPASVLIDLTRPDPAAFTSIWLLEPDGEFRLPLDSSWRITAYIEEADGTISLLTHNQLVMDRDQEVVLDARRARPLDITVPDRRAAPRHGAVGITRTADPFITFASISGELEKIFTADLGPTDLPGVTTQVHATFEGPERPSSLDNPDLYHLGWVIEDSFITGLERRVSRRELATVHAQYAQNATGMLAHRYNTTVPEDPNVVPLALRTPSLPTPGRRTEYYTGGVRWNSWVLEAADVAGSWALTLEHAEDPGYRPGHSYSEIWNGAVLNTTLAGSVIRRDDAVVATFDRYTDGHGNLAFPYAMTNHQLTLHRGETLLGESTYLNGGWEVAAEPATYRMRYAFELPEPFRLSRRMETEWTFTSSADRPGELPLTSIGFRPPLGLDNSARPGSVLAVPLTFAQQASAGRIRSVRVSVSYDDGRSWEPVRTPGWFGHYSAIVAHPRRSGFVSLRATAVDSEGNTVTTTVYRAYALG